MANENTVTDVILNKLEAELKDAKTLVKHLRKNLTGQEPVKCAANDKFDCLVVTNVQVFPFKDGPSLGHIKALATVVLNDQFLVRGLRVMEGENGLFLGYPNDPFYKGEDFCSICNPITRQLRETMENAVLEKYLSAIHNG